MRLDFQAAKDNVDLRELVSRYTTLNRSLQGPCPFCGGRDRFYLHKGGRACGCRQCGFQGDAVALVAKIESLSPGHALRRLQGMTADFAHRIWALEPPDPWTLADWQAEASGTVRRAEKTLSSPAGTAGRAYLESRGLLEATWRAFGIGFSPSQFDPSTGRRRPAIVLPWEADGLFSCVKYRYCDELEEPSARFGQKKGSKPTLFGLQALRGHAALVATEGEFNALSVWQAASGDVDVVSVGSQKTATSWTCLKRLVAKAGYARVVVWFDERKVAAEAAAVVMSEGVKVSFADAPKEMDANEALCRVGAARVRLAVLCS